MPELRFDIALTTSGQVTGDRNQELKEAGTRQPPPKNKEEGTTESIY